MTSVELAEIIGSLLGSMFAFAGLMYLLLLLRVQYIYAKHSKILECLAVTCFFIFFRQFVAVLLAVNVLGEPGGVGRTVARYLLTVVGLVCSVSVFVRMAQWQFEADEKHKEGLR